MYSNILVIRIQLNQDTSRWSPLHLYRESMHQMGLVQGPRSGFSRARSSQEHARANGLEKMYLFGAESAFRCGVSPVERKIRSDIGVQSSDALHACTWCLRMIDLPSSVIASDGTSSFITEHSATITSSCIRVDWGG